MQISPVQPLAAKNGGAHAVRASWSRREFCERHGISLGTFHNLVNSGALRARKVGAKTIVPADAEAAWLAALPDAA